MRRFCRHLNIDSSSILAQMPEFRQNLYREIFTLTNFGENSPLQVLAKLIFLNNFFVSQPILDFKVAIEAAHWDSHLDTLTSTVAQS